MTFVRLTATSTCPVADRYQDVKGRGRSHTDIDLALGRSARCICTRYIIVRIITFGRARCPFQPGSRRAQNGLCTEIRA